MEHEKIGTTSKFLEAAGYTIISGFSIYGFALAAISLLRKQTKLSKQKDVNDESLLSNKLSKENYIKKNDGVINEMNRYGMILGTSIMSGLMLMDRLGYTTYDKVLTMAGVVGGAFALNVIIECIKDVKIDFSIKDKEPNMVSTSPVPPKKANRFKP